MNGSTRALSGYRGKLIAVLAAVGLVYAAAVAALYVNQRDLVFAPNAARAAPASAGLAGVEEVIIGTPDGERLVAWWSPPKDALPVILDFHGQGGTPSGRAHRISAFVAAGYGILTPAYRGFGGSTGRPSEGALIADGILAFDWLLKRNIAAARVVVFGESLGTGVAVQVAAERPVAGVILDSPYTSLADVAQGRFPWLPVRWLMHDQFQSMTHIQRVTAPMLIFHGDLDTVVPYALGAKLYAAAPGPKEMLTIPGGFHTVPFEKGPWIAITRFLKGLAKAQ